MGPMNKRTRGYWVIVRGIHVEVGMYAERSGLYSLGTVRTNYCSSQEVSQNTLFFVTIVSCVNIIEHTNIVHDILTI